MNNFCFVKQTAEIISLIIDGQPEHQLPFSEITECSDHLPSWKFTIVKNVSGNTQFYTE